MSVGSMFGRSPKISPVEPDADDAHRSYLSTLALSRQARTHGVVHTMSRTAGPSRTTNESVTAMGIRIVKSVLANVAQFVAQKEGESTVKGQMGNAVPVSINQEWNKAWGEFGAAHNIPPATLKTVADASEGLFAAELGADHGRIHPSGIVTHAGQQYAKQHVEAWGGLMRAMASAHGVPDDSLHAFANRLTAIGGKVRQLRPQVLHRAR